MKDKETKETKQEPDYKPPTKVEFFTCVSLIAVIVIIVFVMFRSKEEA